MNPVAGQGQEKIKVYARYKNRIVTLRTQWNVRHTFGIKLVSMGETIVLDQLPLTATVTNPIDSQ